MNGSCYSKVIKTLKTLGTVSGISGLSGEEEKKEKTEGPVIQSSIPSGPQKGITRVTTIYFGRLLDESFFPFADVSHPPSKSPPSPQKRNNFIYYKDL